MRARCAEPVDGQRCVLEVEHDGRHVPATEMLGPALVKLGLAGAELELHVGILDREIERTRRLWWLLVVATAVNVGAALWNIGTGLGWW